MTTTAPDPENPTIVKTTTLRPATVTGSISDVSSVANQIDGNFGSYVQTQTLP